MSEHLSPRDWRALEELSQDRAQHALMDIAEVAKNPGANGNDVAAAVYETLLGLGVDV
jgi:hypothetical protein